MTVTFEHLKANLGRAIALAESGGEVVIVHGSTGRPRARIVAIEPSVPDTSWTVVRS